MQVDPEEEEWWEGPGVVFVFLVGPEDEELGDEAEPAEE